MGRLSLALLIIGCGAGEPPPPPIVQEQPPIGCSLPSLCRMYVESCSCRCRLVGQGAGPLDFSCISIPERNCSSACDGWQAVCVLPSFTCELRRPALLDR